MDAADLSHPSDITHSTEQGKRLADRIRVDICILTHDSVHNLEVSVTDSAVVVSGRTSRYYYKQLSTRAVIGATADLDIQNQIDVQEV